MIVAEVLERSRALLPRFSIFALSPIPMLIHLGFLLSDRVAVECRQFDRVRKTWRWSDLDDEGDADELETSGLPCESVNAEDVVIRVSLSAPVTPQQTDLVVPDTPVKIDLTVPDPDVMWLRSPAQLAGLQTEFGRVLKALRRYATRCKRIHLFYAGPAGGAVVLGQAVNPRMDPEIITYEYSRQQSPLYRTAIVLKEQA